MYLSPLCPLNPAGRNSLTNHILLTQMVITTLGTPGNTIRVSLFCSHDRSHVLTGVLRKPEVFGQLWKGEEDGKYSSGVWSGVLATLAFMEQCHLPHPESLWNGGLVLRHHIYVIAKGANLKDAVPLAYCLSLGFQVSCLVRTKVRPLVISMKNRKSTLPIPVVKVTSGIPHWILTML